MDDNDSYRLVITDNIYVSLYWGDRFLNCYDNCLYDGEEIMEKIEKRTRMKFYDIPVEMDRGFTGFRFSGLRGFHSFYSDEVRNLKGQKNPPRHGNVMGRKSNNIYNAIVAER